MQLKHKKARKETAALEKRKRVLGIAALLLSVGLIAAAAVIYSGRSAQQPAPPMQQPEVQPPQQSTQPEPPPAYGEFVSQQLYDAYCENNDVVGWLTVDGCEIDNRVFQAADNDYYLRLDEQGNYDIWGCYFLDYINVQDGYDLDDRVYMIYGHSLDDTAESEKFSKLKRYRDAQFAAQHPYIRFDLLYCEMKWEVFACCNIPITIDYIDPNPGDAKMKDTLGYMLDNSFVDFGVGVSTEDRILILSTCTSDDNVRFVVAAKLVAAGEDALS